MGTKGIFRARRNGLPARRDYSRTFPGSSSKLSRPYCHRHLPFYPLHHGFNGYDCSCCNGCVFARSSENDIRCHRCIGWSSTGGLAFPSCSWELDYSGPCNCARIRWCPDPDHELLSYPWERMPWVRERIHHTFLYSE